MIEPQSDWIKRLNPTQKESVVYNNGRGPLLVIAGAGSGKTRILTSRIIYMIEQGIAPYQILAVTFTNKAAAEMRARIRAQIDQNVTIGTFHSICLNILRAHAGLVGLRDDFTIYDDQDQVTLIKECMKELKLDPKQVNPKGVREKISRCKDSLKSPADFSREVASYDDRLFLPIYEKYEQKMVQYNGVDFGDLIAKAVRLFLKHDDVLARYQERYQYILVDEYQDTNYAQYMFVYQLAQRYHNITVVGDPDQSIYEWRGANIENILNFEKDYSNVKVVRLEQNYRSTNTILKAANAVIAYNMNRKSKNLWSEKGDGQKIDLYRATDERDEAFSLVNNIVQAMGDGYSLSDMVGFYRMHAQSRVIEEELRRHNIPYKIIGGVKFYARREVKDVLAYLRVIDNPGDEISLKRIINVPKRAVGDKAIEKLVLLREERQVSLFDALLIYAQEEKKPTQLGKALRSFHEMIVVLRSKRANTLLMDLVKEVLDASGYMDMLKTENTIESRSRIENIEELVSAIVEFETSLPHDIEQDTLRAYLELISLQSEVDKLDDEASTFTLMTLHCAKGLEYPLVFMLGMEEELLPHANSVKGSPHQVEEERRLCYVGMTRAQERLFLSCAAVRRIFGYERMAEPSRFLDEIPRELLNQVGLRGKRPSALKGDYSLEYDDEYCERAGMRKKRQGFHGRDRFSQVDPLDLDDGDDILFY